MGFQNSAQKRLRKIPWERIKNVMENFGWEQTVSKPNVKIYQLGNAKIVASKIGSKWKVAYIVGKYAEDFGGVTDEEFAKRLAVEMATLKT